MKGQWKRRQHRDIEVDGKGRTSKQADRKGWDARNRRSRGARARHGDARKSRMRIQEEPQLKLEGEWWDTISALAGSAARATENQIVLDRTSREPDRPDRCVNRKAVGQIFHEGIYLGVSVWSYLWALKYASILLLVFMDLYKNVLSAHSIYRVFIIIEIHIVVLLSLSLPRTLCLSFPLNLLYLLLSG